MRAFLAIAVGLFATTVGLDRDRAFYPTATVVGAAYYVLFAVMGASTHALVVESVIAAAFVAAAAFDFRSSFWVVAAALALHGAMDLVHGAFVSNPGVPGWWPDFCASYDRVAAGYLAWLIKSKRVRVAA